MAEIRDDIRVSWHPKGNRAQLKDLIAVLRKLHRRRPDIDIVNLSGDIRVANAFSFQPLGFTKALYQFFMSSALTNREISASSWSISEPRRSPKCWVWSRACGTASAIPTS